MAKRGRPVAYNEENIIDMIMMATHYKSRTMIKEILELHYQFVFQCLDETNVVRLKGFGTLRQKWVPAHNGTNPKTQEPIIKPGKFKITYTRDAGGMKRRPGSQLKK